MLVNPTFADADGDKVPDKWKASAPAEGETLRVATEGDAVRILDADKTGGAGLAQYVAIEPGHKYKFTAQVKSAGGLSLYIQFLDRVPAKEGEISKHRITETRQMAAASTEFKEFSVTATAPASAKQARIWFYCPKIGLTDALVKQAVLEDQGAVPMLPTAAAAPAAGGSAAGTASSASASALVNPELKDADTDGLPDGWRVFPDADGTATKVAMAPAGGVQILDADKTKGIGLQQQLPAQAGVSYALSASLKGTSGISLNFQFLSDKPARDSEMRKYLINDKRVFATGTPEGKETTLTATAPAGTKWMRVWLYCPNIGVTDVVVEKVRFESSGVPADAALSPVVASVAPVVATVAPAAGGAGAGSGLANSELKDADADGVPDSWRVFPEADGTATKLAMNPAGGVQITDTDKTKGIGLQQQIAAEAGTAYTVSALLKGTGSISLNFQFLSDKPARDSEMRKSLISDKRVFGAGSPEGKEITLTAVAPAGTRFMRIWFYCPNIGVADVTVDKVRLSTGAAPAVVSAAPAVVSAAPAPRSDKLLFVGDFESNNYEGWNTQFPHSTKGQIVESPVRAGKYASRSELTYADFKAFGDSRNRRCEVYTENVGKPGEERWYGFSIYLPKGWEELETFDIVMQIHNKPDPGEGPKSPILTLETHGKDWVVNNRWDKEKISKPGEHGSGGTITSNRLWQGPYEVEKWTDWVLHVKWSLEDDGLIEVWKNGEKVAEHKGPNGYNDEQPYYMKVGVYKPAYRVTAPPQRVLYHDEVRIGNEKASYADVAPPGERK